MMFKNRDEASDLLIKKLMKYKNQNVIVAGIPRGAMPMAQKIAAALNAKLTAVLVHKIPAPENEELAIGCVGISGHIHSLRHSSYIGIDRSYIEAKAQDQLEVLKKRKQKYLLEDIDYKNKIVILVDDGIATGATTTCAVYELRSEGAVKIILATPVASSESARQLSEVCDEFICLYVSSSMYSISQFYEYFPQVSDGEVIKILQSHEEKFSQI